MRVEGEALRILEACPEPGLILSAEGRVAAANAAGAALFGVEDPGLAVGRLVLEFLPVEPGRSSEAVLARTLQAGAPLRFDLSRGERFFQGTLTPLAVQGGQEGGAVLFLRDRTQMRQADVTLRQEKQRQYYFMEALPGFAILLGPDLEIIYANAFFRKRFKARGGSACHQAMHGREVPCAGCPALEAMAGEKPRQWTVVVADRHFQMHAHPLTDTDGRPACLVLGIDVTERMRFEEALVQLNDRLERLVALRTKALVKKAEQARRVTEKLLDLTEELKGQKEKADAASRSKSEFLANMSHEIRTPLNGMFGMLQLALDGPMGDEERECVLTALDSGKKLLAVLNDILDLSRIEANRIELRRGPFCPSEIMAGVADIFRLEAVGKGLALEIVPDPGLPDVLIGDEGRIRQTLFNLVGNAVKFTRRGRVRLEAWTSPGLSPGGEGALVFLVSDTGPGVPDDMLDRIFEVFTQVSGHYSREHGGVGLGLGIVRRLSALMGGGVCLDSREGEGSDFYLSVRVDSPSPEGLDAAGKAAVPEEARKAPRRLLVAEDDPVNRKSLELLLSRQGFAVTCAADGKQALETLIREDFDCVLMDVQMPHMSGLDATRAIRNSPGFGSKSAIPIIAVTAHAMAGDRERFLEAGMDAYVPKPVDLGLLTAAIERIMAERAARTRGSA